MNKRHHEFQSVKDIDGINEEVGRQYAQDITVYTITNYSS